MFKKFKPFSGYCPVPILPSSQVAATSYMQHLAYLEWYIAQLQNEIEQSGSVVANPELTGDEPDLTGIQINGENYAIPEGGSGSDITYASGTCSVVVGNTTVSGGSWERIGDKLFISLPNLSDAMAETGVSTFSLSGIGVDFPAIRSEKISLFVIYSTSSVYLFECTVSGSGSTLLFSNLKVLVCAVGTWTDESANAAYYLQYFTPKTLTLTVSE